MRPLDLLTQGARESELLARIRSGATTPDDVDSVTWPFFAKLQVQTTSWCNAACTTCPYPETSQELPMGWMSEATFERILEQCAGRSVERVSLFLMNEPLVDKRLEAFTGRVRAVLPRAEVTIITNGMLLDRRRAESLAAAGMHEVTVSVNGFEEAAYAATMKGLRFDRVVRNLVAVGAARRAGALGGMDVRVSALELGDTLRRAPEFAERVGLPVFLKPVTNRAGSVDVARFGVDAGARARSARTPCQRPFVKAYVLHDGQMLLCNCDWRRTTVFGNVHDTTLEAMWRGEALRQIRRNHLAGEFPSESPCARCDYPAVVDD